MNPQSELATTGPADSLWYAESLAKLRLYLGDLDRCLLQLGKHIVDCLDHNPRVREMWVKDVPSLTPGLVDVFERIGRRQILPEIFLLPECRKLLTAPLSVQEAVVTRGVQVVLPSKGEGFRVDYVPINSLTHAQARQALIDGGVRTVEEQNEFLRPGPKPRTRDWEIDAMGDLVVNRPCIIPRDAILMLTAKFQEAETRVLEANMKKNQLRK